MIQEEQCIFCQTLYIPNLSDAEKENVFCSKICERNFKESKKQPLEFIDEPTASEPTSDYVHYDSSLENE